MNRRTFLSTTAAPLLGAQGVKKYRTALVGTGWWGMNILRAAMAAGESKVIALCDVDRNQLDPAAAEVARLSGGAPKKYGDYREMLRAEKPEICIVATPDHWHALATIAAVRAGAHYPGGAGARTLDTPPPAGLDWDFWCGPAPWKPYNKAIHPKGFRAYLDYANGTLGDWGVHWMDQILWWTEEKYPRRVFSTAARHIKTDQTDAPDTQVASFEFESFTAVWEHRQYAGNEAEKTNIGCYFYGTEGTFHLGWLDGWTFYPSNRNQRVLHEDPKLHKPDLHNIPELWADFLDAIKTGRRPVNDIESGHRSTAMSLLGMVSAKLGRSVEWDGAKEVVVGDPAANKLLRRDYRAPWKYPA